MASVWYLFRAEARARWRSMLVLVLLLGLAGGTALAAAAGARRTASAYPRYLRAARASDVTIDLPSGFEGRADELAGALPGVVAHSVSIGMAALLAGPDGSPDLAGADQVVASIDGRFLTSDRPALVSGRLPKLDRADEAVVNETMARRRHIAPGDRLTVLRATAADVQAAGGGLPATSPLVLRVTGVVVNNTEVVQDDVSRLNLITLTPAYYAQHQQDALFPRLGLQLRDGHRGVPAVQAAVQRLLPNQPNDPDSGVSVEDTGAIVSRTQHAIKPLLEALVLFAALAGIIGLLVIGQALSRDILVAGADNPIRSAMGADRNQLFLLSLLSGAVVAVAGALAAVGVAVAFSPLFPLNPVRVAEPSRGVSIDAVALAAGALLLVVLVIARAALPAWTASRASARDKPARASRRTDRAIDSLPPSLAVGVRFAVDLRRGGGALPLRASVAGSMAALAALLAFVAFAGNLDHLQRTPVEYGWNWDLGFLSNAGYGVYPPEELQFLDDEPAVAGYAAVSFAEVSVDGVATSALGFASAKEPVLPPVIAGRTFSGTADEVMLGSATLAQLRKSVGDDVTIAIGGSAVRARVVGRTVLPAFGRVDTRRTGLGDGVAMSVATFTRLAEGFHPAAVVVRLTPHAPAAAVGRVRTALGDQARFERSYGPQRPADLVSGVSGPASRLLVGLLGLAAAAALAHTLLGAVRQRRRDLAILKTLGFERSQLRRVVASLATTLLLAALLLGIPAGLVVGGWSWRLFADRLGVLPTTVVPLVAILATVPTALVAANLIAAFPAWSAARTNPAAVLRTE